MSFVEILLIAIGLCFDTLAVSVIGGACVGCLTLPKRVKIILSFALFQAGFTFIGWGVGSSFSSYISSFDHWIAFALLAYVGGKMLLDAFSNNDKNESVDLLNTGKLVIASIATSIDALAVGVSFAMIGMTLSDTSIGSLSILLSCLTIGAVTGITALIGLGSGKKLSNVLGNKCNIIGGMILIGIGIKILIEHLF